MKKRLEKGYITTTMVLFMKVIEKETCKMVLLLSYLLILGNTKASTKTEKNMGLELLNEMMEVCILEIEKKIRYMAEVSTNE